MERAEEPSEGTRNEYVRQVRGLIPEKRPYMRSAITVDAGKEWLGDLTEAGLSSSTRRRYGVALVQFAQFLREQKAIDVTTMAEFREWTLPKNNRERQVWWNWKQLQTCLAKLPAGEEGSIEEKVRVATMLVFATGMEQSAVLGIKGRDVMPRLRTAYANRETDVGKNVWRRRNCQVRKWAWPTFKAYAERFGHNELLFADLSPDRWREAFYNAQAAAGLCTRELVKSEGGHHYYTWNDTHTLHDGRHTLCYLAMTGEDGDKKQGLHYCKQQLGHRDLQMVQRIYANFNLPADALVEESEAVPQLIQVVG
jgi:integrase